MKVLVEATMLCELTMLSMPRFCQVWHNSVPNFVKYLRSSELPEHWESCRTQFRSSRFIMVDWLTDLLILSQGGGL
uniref:F-box domain-containing protein n=1 Tax=Caenorhabditis tropicalis TaxID=1561998 RepID=A0A1I7TL40_9PELO